MFGSNATFLPLGHTGFGRECQLIQSSAFAPAMNGNARNDGDATSSLGADILNPFVHRLELGSTYEKLKVSIYLRLSRAASERDRCSCGRILRDATGWRR